jgi:hypothetical protein
MEHDITVYGGMVGNLLGLVGVISQLNTVSEKGIFNFDVMDQAILSLIKKTDKAGLAFCYREKDHPPRKNVLLNQNINVYKK